MLARMPKFGGATRGMAATFAAVDSVDLATTESPFLKADGLAAAGRQILDTGCVSCHPVRGERLPGVVGVDLEGVADRLRPEWLHKFLYDPGRLKPRTRMPTFFPNGKSALKDVLEGDVEMQLAAMWSYLSDIRDQPLPEKIEQGRVHNFELIPEERPVILRTFMKDAGTHAIAVGFPEQVHVAFDAEAVRMAQFWKGRFLDAHATWFNRFTPPAEPLGHDVLNLPSGGPFAELVTTTDWPSVTGEEAGYVFRGYRLDKSGTPTFLYRFRRWDIEDRVSPGGENFILRQIQVRESDHSASTPESAPIWFRALSGETITRDTPNQCTSGVQVTVTVDDSTGDRLLRQSDGKSFHWVIPVNPAEPSTLTVRYEW